MIGLGSFYKLVESFNMSLAKNCEQKSSTVKQKLLTYLGYVLEVMPILVTCAAWVGSEI